MLSLKQPGVVRPRELQGSLQGHRTYVTESKLHRQATVLGDGAREAICAS